MSNAFKDWWNGTNSPARRLPATTADQIEYIAKAAFNAGVEYEASLWNAPIVEKHVPFQF